MYPKYSQAAGAIPSGVALVQMETAHDFSADPGAMDKCRSRHAAPRIPETWDGVMQVMHDPVDVVIEHRPSQ